MRLLPIEYAVRNLGRAPARSLATAGGCLLVVGLVLSAAAFVRGMERALAVAANPDNVLLLSSGSEESLERSQIDANSTGMIAGNVHGIKETLGVPYVSPEVNLALVVRTSADSERELRAVLRGVTPAAFLVHQRVEMLEGRPPRPGHDEIMVGALAAAKLGLPDAQLATGRTLWFSGRTWDITGRFQAPGTVMDAEIWVPLTDLQVATRRDSLSCVVITLDDGDFDDVDAFAKTRLDLELTAMREVDYYASLMAFYRPVRFMIWATALLASLAGLLGGLNTMYAAFSARAREFGMLQSLGYSRRAIMLSLVQETALLATTGALAAAALGLWLLHGHAVRFSMGVFQLSMDGQVLLLGLAVGLLIGVLGAVPPAWRCLRMPIATALKA